LGDLFEAERHELLSGGEWNAEAVRSAILNIARATRGALCGEDLWPSHVDDHAAGTGPFSDLYLGATGVIWALDHLVREGAVDSGASLAGLLPGIRRRNRQGLSTQGFPTTSFLVGEAGILFTEWKITRSPDLLDELAGVIAANMGDPALEFMWAAPGTMLVALALHEATREARWSELYRLAADHLLDTLIYEPEFGCRLWTQHLYGHRAKLLGAVHGFAGNAFALLRGMELLPQARQDQLSAWIAETVAVTAVQGDLGLNWPQSVGPPRPGRTAMLLQHCHGAPGIVNALAEFAEPIDDILVRAGELIWSAGPLQKGLGLCHGTSGNGFAFLKLFARTGDEKWLHRARLFAMHAIGQSEARAARVGQHRYSLWTGDLGLACYLLECDRATARFPTWDAL